MSRISDAVPPSAIDTSRHFWNAFDNSETETSALWIVRLCQERGGWEPFTVADIEALYHERFPRGRFHLNRLTDARADGPLIAKNEEGLYEVSDDFIYRCYRSSPSEQLEP